MSQVLAASATTTIPASPGCWANSETAVKACCNRFGGVRINLTDSSIPGCLYNVGSGFTADGGPSSSNSTRSRWTACVSTFFNVTADGSVVLSTCQNFDKQIATATSRPSSDALPMGARSAHVVLAGLLAGSALIHVLGLAI
ncbi:hypothetical protein B0H15DRAFT_796388 [Mycena belliarum]|uniref:Uncharacterized protein n=1 Tax=Mycena belliarum TaxID=1033014 RepID=A0AAD6XWA0_9AGAR|nr:hypothetical protein B0H15DRAFT_796388 [Mycena belliae]